MSFYALLISGVFMLGSASIIRNTGGVLSLIVVRIVPAFLGVWCLWEAAIIHLAKTL